jgi:hypothetical protein
MMKKTPVPSGLGVLSGCPSRRVSKTYQQAPIYEFQIDYQRSMLLQQILLTSNGF